jgi:hypothetical protein
MSSQLVADFTTQFAAMAAVNKLLSCGLGREHVAVLAFGSVGKLAARASTSTSVIPNANNQDRQGDDRPSDLCYPSHLPQPAQFGHAQVTVELNDGLSADDIRFILELTGAQSIRSIDQEFLREDPEIWPTGRQGNGDDVTRAIEASRAGESMPSAGRSESS